MSLSLTELERLYAEPSVQAYQPQAVLAHLEVGGVIPALCCNLLPHHRQRTTTPSMSPSSELSQRRLGFLPPT